MEFDRNGFEIPDRDECLRLLATAAIGRVCLSRGALPTVLPVNFVVTEGGIVFRTSSGAKLEAAAAGNVVAFEADDIDLFSRTGWSVVVTGMARELTGPEELDWARALPLSSWGVADTDRYVCISTELVTGRRLPSPQDRPRVAAALTADAV
jgi:uncharacterized protein